MTDQPSDQTPDQMAAEPVEKSISIPLGVVIRRSPGVTRWQPWSWRVVGVLPGAPEADWRELRREGEVIDYHMATQPLELYRTDTESYLTAIATQPPSVYVILNRPDDAPVERPFALHLVTASAFEAQDYQDSGEEIVEPVLMPDGLIAWIKAFVDRHHVQEKFIKRKRDSFDISRHQDGKGDPRVHQPSDVFRAPANRRGEPRR